MTRRAESFANNADKGIAYIGIVRSEMHRVKRIASGKIVIV